MSKESSNIHWAMHLAFVALEILNENDGTMELSDLLNEIEERDDGKEITEEWKATYASGPVKWKMRMQFDSDVFVKAGLLRKSKGVWYLTNEGKTKIENEGKEEIINLAKEKSAKHWKEKKEKKEKKSKPFLDNDTNDAEESKLIDGTELNESNAKSIDDTELNESNAKSIDDTELHESNAISGIKEYIRDMEPYPFQDLCAALLRGMNYHVRDNATPGPDGGIDVLAYTDPLGSRPPRLKVQVKHRHSDKVGIQDLRALAGLLTKGDIGVFISSSGFSAPCRDFARQNERHLELIDLDRLIDLWKTHYNNLAEEDKALLPLYPIYFLDKKRAINA